jgi:preflagellin peptidase FlaK
MILPLVINAIIIGITLLYASRLDIKERRIPAKNWQPMLILTIPLTTLTFFYISYNIFIILGYLALISIFLYALYIEDTDWEKKFGHYYLIITVFSLGISWFFSNQNSILVLLYSPILVVFVVLIFLHTGNRNDNQTLTRIKEIYPVIVLPLFSLGFLFLYVSGSWGILGFYLGLIGIFCTFFYLFTILHLFGGADAWALIFISISIPLFPIEPLLGIPTLQFFPFSMFVNAVILNIAAPFGIFFWNIIKGKRAPIRYLFLGFPVPGDRIEQYYGFVMEDIQEDNGKITRRFLPISKLLGRMFRGEDRKYTKDIRLHPEKYKKEREIFQKAGEVWIVYGVPFLVPITAGFFTALLAGDILYTILRSLAGV